MGHDILERDSQVGIEEAWHGLTTVVPEITEENCEILYPMEMQRMYVKQKDTFNFIPSDSYIVVSLDDNLPIGKPVSDRYELISNLDIWKAVERALDNTDHKVVSIGTICNREKGFLSVKLSDNFVAAKRTTSSVLSVMWGHGGIMNLTAKTGFTVVVCHNTYQWAMAEKGDFSFKVKHVGDADLKLENMQNAIEAHLYAEETFREAMEEFNERAISDEDVQKFFAGFICEDGLTKPSTRAQNQYATLHRLFHDGRGNNGESAADVFNAATNYYTHFSAGGTDNPKRQFESSEFGMSADRKTEVFKILYGAKSPRVGDFEACIDRGKVVLERAAG